MEHTAEIVTRCGAIILVDAADYERLSRYEWQLSGAGYAYTSLPGREHLWMHKWLAGDPKDCMVDHRNHNRRDNRRSNLRLADHSQNQQNRRNPVRPDSKTGVRGVYFDKRRGNYRAYIVLNRKYQHLGRFETLEEAAEASRMAREQLFTHFDGAVPQAETARAVPQV